MSDTPPVASPRPTEHGPAAHLDFLAGLDLPTWMSQGLCAQTDPEAFYPEKGGSTKEAKAVCRRCPVTTECLEYALNTVDRFGIWGGLSERERRKLLRRRDETAGGEA